jgi:YD repeat-containing protein
VAGTSYTYDADGRLTKLTHTRGGNTLADYGWQYDAANRITQFTSADGTSNYNYDDRDQLTGTDHSYQGDELKLLGFMVEDRTLMVVPC